MVKVGGGCEGGNRTTSTNVHQPPPTSTNLLMHRFAIPALMLAALACSDGNGPSGVPSLTLSPLLDSVFVGDTLPAGSFGAVYRDAAGQVQLTPTLRWYSGDPAILSVDSVSGRVVAAGRGNTAVEARGGDAVGRALVVVSRSLEVTLLLDTVYLMPGDTFTVPVSVTRQGGSPPPVRFTPSVNPAIYTIDTVTGQITAVAGGAATRLVARADTVADTGAVEVVVLSDTLGGKGFFTVLGTVIRRANAVARAVNYRRQGDTLTFRLNLSISSGAQVVENVVLTLRAPVTAAGTFTVDSITPAEAFGTGSDFICRPARSWSLWSARGATDLVALSRAGSIGVARVSALTNGQAISGSFVFEARRTDFYDELLGRLPVRGTFVAPLIADNRPCS